MKGIPGVVIFFMLLISSASAGNYREYTEYCNKAGGKVEDMVAEFGSANGQIEGCIKKFCTFTIEKGVFTIGLETFATDRPNIAATLMKKLSPLKDDSPLWKNDSGHTLQLVNPSYTVCKNLGGTMIGYVLEGSFGNDSGQTDMCVFGDGSMVSGWTLIYTANNRAGYTAVREKIHSAPLEMVIPGQ